MQNEENNLRMYLRGSIIKKNKNTWVFTQIDHITTERNELFEIKFPPVWLKQYMIVTVVVYFNDLRFCEITQVGDKKI